MDSWAVAGPSSGFINGDGNHRDVDSFVTSPSHNASPNQALAGTLGATVTRDQHIPIWSLDLSPSNRGFQQQQVVGIPNNGWNNEWNLDVPPPPAWNSASQGFAQSLSHVTSGFGQYFIPTSNSVDNLSVYSNAMANGQPDPILQLPDLGVYNDSVAMPNSFANSASFTQWDNSTAIDPQETMASFNQFPLPTTTGMPAAMALPTYATSMFTAPTVPLPVAGTVVPRRSIVNTNAPTCDFAGCGKIFSRPDVLARHRQKHGIPQYPCLIHGCNRRRSKAFYRADKLRDHQRKRHGMAI